MSRVAVTATGAPASYAAFISYSHAVSGKLAAMLQRWLERFATPWYRPRSLRIFRDSSSLSANEDLWQTIERALAASEWFILLASPEAADSKWVRREVEWWRTHRSARRMCIALTGGELHWNDLEGDWDWGRSTALPPNARGMFDRLHERVGGRRPAGGGSCRRGCVAPRLRSVACAPVIIASRSQL